MGAREVVTKLRYNCIKSDLNLVTAENRQEVIRRLWSYVNQVNPDYPDEQLHTIYDDCYILLLRLGDRQIIEKVSNIYRKSTEASVSGSWIATLIRDAKQPLALPVLFETISSQESPEPKWVRGADYPVLVFPVSMEGPLEAMWVVRNSDVFSTEVRTWAGDMLARSRAEPSEVRNALRLWWKQNGTAVSWGDFKKVNVPLPEGEIPGHADISTRPPPSNNEEPTSRDAKNLREESRWIPVLVVVLIGTVGWLFVRLLGKGAERGTD